MGNAIPNRLSDAPGKVILSDGTIHYYDKPLTVAELMLEYPQQLVVEFQQQHHMMKKPAPLPADKKLEMNKVYLMLPIRRGKPAALSSEEASILLLKANSFLKSKSLLSSSTGFLPLFARMCAAGSGLERDDEHYAPAQRKKKPDHNINYRQQKEATCKTDYFTDILMEERPEFLSRQISGKGGWKPSLDTITEKTVKTKVRHWLF